AAFTRFGYVPAPLSIYEGVSKLMPGTYLRLREGGTPEISSYWRAESAAQRGLQNRSSLSDAGAVDGLEALLGDAGRTRMAADVPLGALLSGGVDSSAVVALMQAASTAKIRTFTIGFAEREYDEAHAARAVAAHLGTDHTELDVDPAQAQALVPRLPFIYD